MKLIFINNWQQQSVLVELDVEPSLTIEELKKLFLSTIGKSSTPNNTRFEHRIRKGMFQMLRNERMSILDYKVQSGDYIRVYYADEFLRNHNLMDFLRGSQY